MRFPQGRTVKAVAGLDWTGLWALTVFIPQNLCAVAAPGGLVSARHCPGHQTNPTGCRTGTPLSSVPPAKQGIYHKTAVHQNGSTFTPCRHKESIIQSLKKSAVKGSSLQVLDVFKSSPREAFLAASRTRKFMKVKFVKVNTSGNVKSDSRAESWLPNTRSPSKFTDM